MTSLSDGNRSEWTVSALIMFCQLLSSPPPRDHDPPHFLLPPLYIVVVQAVHIYEFHLIVLSNLHILRRENR